MKQPKIEHCKHQKWDLSAESYQLQLFCSERKKFVNPSGFTCNLCRMGVLDRELSSQTQPPTNETCEHLGDLVGYEDCKSCGGNVRIKVYVCGRTKENVKIADCICCKFFHKK